MNNSSSYRLRVVSGDVIQEFTSPHLLKIPLGEMALTLLPEIPPSFSVEVHGPRGWSRLHHYDTTKREQKNS